MEKNVVEFLLTIISQNNTTIINALNTFKNDLINEMANNTLEIKKTLEQLEINSKKRYKVKDNEQ